MAKKRRAGGRVTPRGGAADPARSSSSSRSSGGSDGSPSPSGRYTPPTPAYRVRPTWHRVAGWVILVLGIAIIALNDLMLMGDDLVLLPFGHSELYLFLGIAVSAGATWFLGLFDRGQTIYG